MKYNKTFFNNHKDGSLSSARVVVPMVIKLFGPKKVIDIGCGIGTWLSIFKEKGVDEIFGIDGKWIDKRMLLIPQENFQSSDLKNPPVLDKNFDLVVSLEVAEHLSPKCAEKFINYLVSLGPVILFSAAIPYQGPHHLNEQWPEYWEKFFIQRGYVAVDCLRRKIWNNKNVAWWYAQNIVIFVQKEYLETNEKIKNKFADDLGFILPIVHPENYLSKIGFKSIIINITPNPIINILKRLKNLLLIK